MDIHPVESRVAALETGFTALQSDMREIKSSISTIGSQLSASARTDWQSLAAIAGLVVTILGAFGWLAISSVNADLDKVVEKLDKQSAAFVTHIADGHPRRVEAKADRNAQAVIDLDTTLQREMRLLDDAMQREMRLLHEPRDVSLKDLSRRASEARDWMKEHDRRVVGLNAAQWERIRALERAVYGEMGPNGAGK